MHRKFAQRCSFWENDKCFSTSLEGGAGKGLMCVGLGVGVERDSVGGAL